VAHRLRIVQKMAGLNQAAMAERLQISFKLWSKMVTGAASLSRFTEDKLLDAFPGLSVEWLRRGERRGLSVEMDQRLREAADSEHQMTVARDIMKRDRNLLREIAKR
jgi:transcriptional regulator with XRE-family HTH domain